MLIRWRAVLAALIAISAATAGCRQQCFLTECDYDHYRGLGLPPHDCDPSLSVTPTPRDGAAPSDVVHPERQIRYISLSEAIAIALEQGTVGIENEGGPTGTIADRLVSFTGRSVVGDDAIRVLALDPAIIGTDIESSLSKFDARWTSSMVWQSIDRPIATAEEVVLTGGLPLTAIQAEEAFFRSSLLKPLPSGGVAGITFRTDYELSNLNSPVNPAYRPSLQFQFEQPLLQGYGVEINQLRTSHPGSILTPFPNVGRFEGILITRLRFDEQRAEFERRVNELLVNVELAYWNLYGAYWNLYSREQGLRQAFAAWRYTGQRFAVGGSSGAQYALTRQQYELFRGERVAALAEVQEKERQLRGLMGLPVEDGSRLVPADTPTLASYRPDWTSALNEAMALRPELVLARQEVKVRQLEVINQKNLLLPDLRFTSTYGISGIGTHLDGGSSDPNNAFHSLAQDRFTDWSLGLRLDVPIGFRDAHAAVRAARLLLAQSYALLQDQELKAQRYLALQYRRVSEMYERIEAARSQREAAAQQLALRFQEFAVGRGTLEFLLSAQIAWANALRDEYALIVEYNNALATFQFAKGSMLQHDNVVIGEGPLPRCAQVRAVVHEHERTAALVLRERAKPVVYQQQRPCPAPCPHAPCDHDTIAPPDLPAPSALEASSLPTLMENGAFIPPSQEPVSLPRSDELSDLNLSLTRPAPMQGGNGREPAATKNTESKVVPPRAVREPEREADSLGMPSIGSSYLPTINGQKSEPKAPTTAPAKRHEGSPVSDSASLIIPQASATAPSGESKYVPPSQSTPYAPFPANGHEPAASKVQNRQTGELRDTRPGASPAIPAAENTDGKVVPPPAVREPEREADSLGAPSIGSSYQPTINGQKSEPKVPAPAPVKRLEGSPGQVSDSASLTIPQASLPPLSGNSGHVPESKSTTYGNIQDLRRPQLTGPMLELDSLSAPRPPAAQAPTTPQPSSSKKPVPPNSLAPVGPPLALPGQTMDSDSLAIPPSAPQLPTSPAKLPQSDAVGSPPPKRCPPSVPSPISDGDSLALPATPGR
jgi:outer membrane protein TolC